MKNTPSLIRAKILDQVDCTWCKYMTTDDKKWCKKHESHEDAPNYIEDKNGGRTAERWDFCCDDFRHGKKIVSPEIYENRNP